MRTLHAMSYNKTLFDKTHIPYPSDGMTWEEWIPWAEHIRSIVGDNILGDSLGFGYPLLEMQHSTSILNPHTGKAELNNPKWQTIASVFNQYPSETQNPFELYSRILGPSDDLHKLNYSYSLDVAYAVKFINSLMGERFDLDSDWDMVSFPAFEDSRGIGPDFVGEVLSVNPNSEHKEEAFALLSYLVSDE